MTEKGSDALCVLIVDDDSGCAAALVEALEIIGCRVERCATGAAAMQRAAALQPDVVLLDLNLPDGDGADLARRMAQHVGAATRFIALSGRPVAQAQRDAFAACLLKPIGLAELHDAVNRASP